MFERPKYLALLTALGLLILAAATSPWWWPAPRRNVDVPAGSDATAPQRWAASADAAAPTQLAVRLDPEIGPVLETDAGPHPLTPLPEDWSARKWTRRQSKGHTVVVGRGTTGGHNLKIRWEFAPGNPQAQLHYRLRDVPFSTLEQSRLAVALSLPGGQLSFVDRRLHKRTLGPGATSTIGPWRPHWAQWQGKGTDSAPTLTFSGWTGDTLSVRADSGEQNNRRLEFGLWSANRHLPPSLCATREDDAETTRRLDLRARLTLTVGPVPAVVASPFPDGRAAAVLPIFDTPTAHPDETLHMGAARSAEEWVDRVRTLAHGHSSTDDPRFGNGGLLGHGLGGTVVIPERFADDDAARQFLARLQGSDLDVAARTTTASPRSELPVRIGTSTRCTTDTTKDDAAPTVIIPSFHTAEHGLVDALASEPPKIASPAHLRPLAVSPVRLDGRRSSLLEATFGQKRLRTLLESRGIATFSTPLLGSRNPLIPAAKEALLSPERHGQWTLSAPFAESLANLELLRESQPFWMAGASLLTDHWSAARSATVRWTPEGTLQIKTPDATSVPGFTLLVPGQKIGRARVDGTPPTGLRTDASPASWIWWPVAADQSHRVDLTGPEDTPLKAPPPVQWRWTGGG